MEWGVTAGGCGVSCGGDENILNSAANYLKAIELYPLSW